MHLDNTSPIFSAMLNGVSVSLTAIDQSYIKMIDAFLQGNEKKLWSLQDALKATEKVLAL